MQLQMRNAAALFESSPPMQLRCSPVESNALRCFLSSPSPPMHCAASHRVQVCSSSSRLRLLPVGFKSESANTLKYNAATLLLVACCSEGNAIVQFIDGAGELPP